MTLVPAAPSSWRLGASVTDLSPGVTKKLLRLLPNADGLGSGAGLRCKRMITRSSRRRPSRRSPLRTTLGAPGHDMGNSLNDIPPLLHDGTLNAFHWDRYLRTLNLSFECLRRNVDGTPIEDRTVD